MQTCNFSVKGTTLQPNEPHQGGIFCVSNVNILNTGVEIMEMMVFDAPPYGFFKFWVTLHMLSEELGLRFYVTAEVL